MDNITALRRELFAKTYRHGGYYAFKINDPKPRDIHKASVRDRLVHHALVRVLYPYFDKKFVYDSYSCRVGKGTHRAVKRFREFAASVSENNTRACWVLKCDIRKFFANIDHGVLIHVLSRHVADQDALWLLGQVIESFHAQGKGDVGLPLGNLTSQLLVNIYMNDFDHFVKRQLKARCYIRYADDFVILSHDKALLERLLLQMEHFLVAELKLELHPDKVSITTLASGVDFLGWVHFANHRVLRTATKRRMFARLASSRKEKSVDSYLGLLSHGNTHWLRKKISIQHPNSAGG